MARAAKLGNGRMLGQPGKKEKLGQNVRGKSFVVVVLPSPFILNCWRRKVDIYFIKIRKSIHRPHLNCVR